MLNHRELVSLLWVAIAAVWILSKPELRSSLKGIGRSLLHPAIAIPIFAMCGYIVCLVRIAATIGLWDWALLKETAIWALGSGVVAFFNSTQASSDPRFFRRLTFSTIGIAAFIEFFVNLYVLSLAGEFFLQLVLLVLSLMVAVAGNKPEHRPVKVLCEVLLAGIGFALLHYTIRQAYGSWAEADLKQLGLEFMVPIWLTLGFLPFIYGVSVYAGYDSAFRGINRATNDRRTRWRSRLAIISVLHLKTRKVNRFGWNWADRLAATSSLKAARAVVAAFVHEQRRKSGER